MRNLTQEVRKVFGYPRWPYLLLSSEQLHRTIVVLTVAEFTYHFSEHDCLIATTSTALQGDSRPKHE